MQRIEVCGLVYEFEDDLSLMSLLDENADRVYDGMVTGRALPNDPLTLKELREMDGEPVWVSTGRLSEWCIVHSCHSDDVIGGGIIVTRRTAEKRTYQYVDYGKTWMAYRRKPEEGTA